MHSICNCPFVQCGWGGRWPACRASPACASPDRVEASRTFPPSPAPRCTRPSPPSPALPLPHFTSTLTPPRVIDSLGFFLFVYWEKLGKLAHWIYFSNGEECIVDRLSLTSHRWAGIGSFSFLEVGTKSLINIVFLDLLLRISLTHRLHLTT